MNYSEQPIRKAAILISSLDERTADRLLDQMGDEQAARVRNAMMRLGDVPTEEQEAVLTAFFNRTPPASADEVELAVKDPVTVRAVLDALEASYPTLRGTIRDHATRQRRPLVRFFACQEDLSHEPPDTPLPNAIVTGAEPFLIVGAMAGG